MYRKLLAVAAAAMFAASLFAMPAKRGPYTYTQPDGTQVLIELHGDEFFRWNTYAGTNTVVEQGKDGFWRPSTIDVVRRRAAQKRSSEENGRRMAFRARGGYEMTHGEHHIPVILVNFSDVSFSIENPREEFYALLNEEGYSKNRGTGSARDYFLDNSHGVYRPEFDVYGPVTLPHEMKYYGEDVQGSDRQPELALFHAAQALNDQIDFSKYDFDSDGKVDMILLYYAGYSQAEGASSNAIWPHQWNLQFSSSSEARNATFDGKKLANYFCTAELSGRSGTNMCGIGPTCHEFSHSIGLPDFYDTDYEENGRAGGLYDFSIMCSGGYNNNSRTPPYYNAEERVLLFWMDASDIQELPAGDVSFEAINNNVAYKSLTDIEGEYFLYECRDATGWDTPLPGGMVVYHVDKSKVRRVLGRTPYEHWKYWESYNSINADGSHPCFYVIPAANAKALNFKGSLWEMVFPGTKSRTEYSPVDWDGNKTGISLSKIKYNSGTVSLTAEYNIERRIAGTVSDQYGRPVQGVYVVVSQPASGSSSIMRKAPRKEKSYEAVTDSEGSFLISLSGYQGEAAHLSFSKSGYRATGQDVDLEPRITRVSAVLYKEGESEVIEYSYFDPSATSLLLGDAEHNSLMAAIKIPVDALPDKGGKLKSVTYYPAWRAKAYYLIVDSGEERILTKQLPSSNSSKVKYELGNDELDFTADKPLYIGLAIEQASVSTGYTGYLFSVTEGADNCYLDDFNLEQSNWGGSGGYALKLSAAIAPKKDDGGVPQEPEVKTLADMGFNSISDPGNGKYEPGTAFALDIDLAPGVVSESVTWTFDGKDVTGAKSVTLEKGHHTITANLKTADGGSEVLQLVLDI